MHFDRGDTDRGNGIPECHTRVGVSGSVDNDDVHLTLGLLNPSHKFSFDIGLPELNLGTQVGRPLPDHLFDVLQRYLAVHARLPLAEQIQIRTIKHQDAH